MTVNAKLLFIKKMRASTSVYFSRMGADFAASAELKALYFDMAVKAINEMTFIACKENPEAFQLFVLTNACSTILLDPANTDKIIAGGKLTSLGQSIMDLYQKGLDQIASDPNTPAGQHNKMQLDFVKSELAKRM